MIELNAFTIVKSLITFNLCGKFHSSKSPRIKVLKTLTLTQANLKYSDCKFPKNNNLDKQIWQKLILDSIILWMLLYLICICDWINQKHSIDSLVCCDAWTLTCNYFIYPSLKYFWKNDSFSQYKKVLFTISPIRTIGQKYNE